MAMETEAAGFKNQAEVAVQDMPESTMFMSAMKAPDQRVNTHAKQQLTAGQKAKGAKNKKGKQQPAKENSVQGGLLLQKLGTAPQKAAPKANNKANKAKQAAPQMKQAAPVMKQAAPGPKKAKAQQAMPTNKNKLPFGTPMKNLMMKRNVFQCRSKDGQMHKCMLQGALPDGGFKVSVQLPNGMTMNNVRVLGSELKPQITSAVRTPMAPNDKWNILNHGAMGRRGYFEATDKNGNAFEAVVHARNRTGFTCTIITNKGTTHTMCHVPAENLMTLGTKNTNTPMDWSANGLPSRTKPVDLHDTQDMSVDWTVNGVPAQIRNTDWSAFYNMNKSGGKSARLVMDWSGNGLPMSFEQNGAAWSRGAMEAAYDPPMIQMDWSQNALPELGGTGQKWLKKAMQEMNPPEIECDWSTKAMPMQIRGPIWSSSFQGMQRGMQSAAPKKAGKDHAKLLLNWAVKGLPMEAEGQQWTQGIGGFMGQRLRCLRQINKQIARDMGSTLNPKKNGSMKNYNLTQLNSAVDAVAADDVWADTYKVKKFKFTNKVTDSTVNKNHTHTFSFRVSICFRERNP